MDFLGFLGSVSGNTICHTTRAGTIACNGMRVVGIGGVSVYGGDRCRNNSRVYNDNAGIHGRRMWTKRNFNAKYRSGFLYHILYQSALCYAGRIPIVVRSGVWTGVDVHRRKTQNATK